MANLPSKPYCGRLAPSPTGLLHLGHARTFWIARERARTAHSTGSDQAGTLFLRKDDLDRSRCRQEFVDAMIEDLRWFGFEWTGSMVTQSERIPLYRAALARLHAGGWIYPCHRSRRDVLAASSAPHEGEDADEPVFPPEFRPPVGAALPRITNPIEINWRFRVPDGETLVFSDGHFGEQRATAGRDFGDFLVWRKDDAPSYQLACVVDDADMQITEVVRGGDLIKSTFRQLLLFRALGLSPPSYFHCPLVTDEHGTRLAKRHDALALRTLRLCGKSPEQIRAEWK